MPYYRTPWPDPPPNRTIGVVSVGGRAVEVSVVDHGPAPYDPRPPMIAQPFRCPACDAVADITYRSLVDFGRLAPKRPRRARCHTAGCRANDDPETYRGTKMRRDGEPVTVYWWPEEPPPPTDRTPMPQESYPMKLMGVAWVPGDSGNADLDRAILTADLPDKPVPVRIGDGAEIGVAHLTRAGDGAILAEVTITEDQLGLTGQIERGPLRSRLDVRGVRLTASRPGVRSTTFTTAPILAKPASGQISVRPSCVEHVYGVRCLECGSTYQPPEIDPPYDDPSYD